MDPYTNTTTITRSPWGRVQDCRSIGPGIVSVSTAGHGGIKLGRFQNARVHAAWRKPGGWYEEDCEWAIVALTFHTGAGFSLEYVEAARQVAKDLWPDAYQAVYGIPLDASESRELRERAAKLAAKGRMQILSCWGDWATKVPAGMVGVFARIDGREGGPGAAEGYYLITRAQYEAEASSLPVRVLPEDATALAVSNIDGRKPSCPFRSAS